jgi:phage tail-like protein
MKAEKIARLLPEIFQATAGTSGPLDGFLAAQERLHAPCESAIGGFADQLDPRRAAPPFVYLLAHWMDLDCLLDGPAHAPRFAAGVGRLRELIASAARNARERGTERTLIRLLETATGCTGFKIETDSDSIFRFTVHAPQEARAFSGLVSRIVAAEKPAFAVCELRFAAAGAAEDVASDGPVDASPDAAIEPAT